MTVVSDGTERTVLKYKPPARVALAVCLLLTFLAALAWRSSGSAGWLAAAVTLLALSIMVVLAMRFNHRLLTFDWEAASVHSRVHHWNPMFKDEIDDWSFRNTAHWQIQQERSLWSLGFARKQEAFQELYFTRSLFEALRIARLLAGHLPKPVRLVTAFDSLECTDLKDEACRFYPVGQDQRASHEAFGAPSTGIIDDDGRLMIVLPMRRRKMRIKSSIVRRWPLFLLQGILCLAVFALTAPHAQPVNPSLTSLIVCMLFGMAGTLCAWIALNDLTGCTRLRSDAGQMEIRSITLGFLDCSSIRLPLSQIQITTVARHGCNACLLLVTKTRVYQVGIGLSSEELLCARNQLLRLYGSNYTCEARAAVM